MKTTVVFAKWKNELHLHVEYAEKRMNNSVK